MSEVSTVVLEQVCKIMGWEYQGSHIMQAQDTMKRLRDAESALRDCITAMKRSSEEGTTDHFDCCEDGGAFWYGAIEKAEALLNGRR